MNFLIIGCCSAEDTLKKHMLLVHESKNLCDYSWSLKSTMKIHIESVHEGRKPLKKKSFKCDFCNTGFSQYNNLKQLLKTEIYVRTRTTWVLFNCLS